MHDASFPGGMLPTNGNSGMLSLSERYPHAYGVIKGMRQALLIYPINEQQRETTSLKAK